MDHVGVWAWMPYVWNVYVFVSSSQLKYHTRSQILCIYSSLFCSLFCFMSFCCNWAIFVIILLLLLLLFGQWMCSHSRKNFWCSFTQTLCENRPTDRPTERSLMLMLSLVFMAPKKNSLRNFVFAFITQITHITIVHTFCLPIRLSASKLNPHQLHWRRNGVCINHAMLLFVFNLLRLL